MIVPSWVRPDITFRTASHAELRELAKRARWAVFAVIVAEPRCPQASLTRFVRAAFAERGLPLDGHNLTLTLAQLESREQIVNVGTALSPAWAVAPALEERWMERRAAAIEREAASA